MDINISGAGVVFIGIAILAALLIGGGNLVTSLGNTFSFQSLSNSGSSMSSFGVGLAVVLVLMGAAVVILKR